ncbi:MAG: hypothetical protein LBS92_04500 [Candidatus Methanoplasma sp.]|nr:hypothetical protein [Candidatus Methanoplasma sp.]
MTPRPRFEQTAAAILLASSRAKPGQDGQERRPSSKSPVTSLSRRASMRLRSFTVSSA